MFSRSSNAARNRAGKSTKPSKASFSRATKQRIQESVTGPSVRKSFPQDPPLTSAIITIVVGRDQRLFAAHEDVLRRSPYLAQACKGQFFESNAKRVNLVDEEAEVFSCVLEYLYKGDYTPRLLHDKRRTAWYLEDVHNLDGAGSGSASTMYHPGVGDHILRDTAVYCAGERYGLEELKRLALRKQGLQTGIQVNVILRSMRYCYEHTPDTDSRLRAHYLALIVRSRKTFKHSGTMQMEMELGGKMFFDLFVAMCNHLDDTLQQGSYTPKTV